MAKKALTVEEAQSNPEDVPETASPDTPDAPPEPTPEEKAVAEAAARVAEAAKAHAEAAATLDTAKAAHAEAVKATEEQPSRAKHILVAAKGTTDYVLRPLPAGYNPDLPDRTVLVDGVVYEHDSDHAAEDGVVWRFRAM